MGVIMKIIASVALRVVWIWAGVPKPTSSKVGGLDMIEIKAWIDERWCDALAVGL
jgi:hypothetical protein